MNDIAKCDGRDCVHKEGCWRYLCPPDNGWQTYIEAAAWPCKNLWRVDIGTSKSARKEGN